MDKDKRSLMIKWEKKNDKNVNDKKQKEEMTD